MSVRDELGPLHFPSTRSPTFTYNSGVFALVAGTPLSLPGFTTLPRRLRLTSLQLNMASLQGLAFRFTLDKVPGWDSVLLRWNDGGGSIGLPIFALVEPLTTVTPIFTADTSSASNLLRLGGFYL